MAKITESPYGTTETYTVKFWYINSEGYHVQGSEDLYCNSKSAHKDVEKYFIKHLAVCYNNARIISVIYN